MSFGVTESEQASAADLKRWMIGGVVATVIIITIIGALIVVYMVKRRKGLNYYCNVKYF